MNNSHTSNRVQCTLDEIEKRTHDAVDQHPLASTALVMGIGFGLGYLLVHSLVSAHRNSARRWIPEEAESWASQLRSHVRDAIHHAVPDAIERWKHAFR